ncbi:hypothetical protein QQS21_000818 [Conoideocrella luteorostrata]|uniref:Cytochrome P450 n=1 Tax=Conoideocrella luteorostrata TaxID=1105319 RepID=A0AAJ0CY28_9HYPO|nr:hypothetical protein QQS21_000818 [Conoideocrella luteorostrata]
MDMFGHANIEAIKTQYISKIGQQVQPTYDEAVNALEQHFERYEDWTPLVIMPKILRIVTQTVGRSVVGKEICRRSEWIDAVISYSTNVFMAATYLKMVPIIMRPLVALLTPYIYRIHLSRYRIRKLIAPAILQQVACRADQQTLWNTGEKDEELHTLDWLVSLSSPEEATVEMISHRLTGVSFGSTHTVSSHITNCVIDLAANFDCLADSLREEINEVLGHNPIDISNADLSKMWKLDSFMKEVQRFHPPSKLSVNRKLMTDLTLSSGDVLPKNAHVSFAGVPMSMSEEYFEDAKRFDAFRFERMRRDPTVDHNGLQFTSSNEGSLHFGHGKQMCPGRFLAGLISKIVIIQLLLRYDIKLRQGEERPQNLIFMDMDIPDPACQIVFRDRRT